MQDNKLRSFKEIDVKKFQKTVLIAATFLMLTVAASAQISQTRGPTGNLVFQNSTGDTVLNISEKGSLPGFFEQGECANNEAIKTINPNGSYECNSISTTTEAEGLSETLAAGNIANQTIEFDSSTGIQIGYQSSSNLGEDIAIGNNAEASSTTPPAPTTIRYDVAVGAQASAVSNSYGVGATALGFNAEADDVGVVSIGSDANTRNLHGAYSIGIGDGAESEGESAIAIGEGSRTDSEGSIAIGREAGFDGEEGQYAVVLGSATPAADNGDSYATGDYSTVLGANGTATAKGAVAIGQSARAPNSYEATFGNLNGEELDLNVTGNATIHGSGGLNVTSGDVVGDDIVSRSGADLAEVYSAERDYEPGTVVSVSSGVSDVESASRFEDVAGVVSTDPGFTLNSGEEGIEVALEGRVPVKVAEPVEEGEDLAAGPDGRAVACETGQVEELSSDASKSKIVDAVNSLSSNQECLKASFGEALNSSQNGNVEVMLD